MEELMEVGIGSTPAYASKPSDFRAELSASKPMAAAAEPRLTRRASLMLTFVLSLGMWVAIWALASAISALISL
jgi:hypothetical protein